MQKAGPDVPPSVRPGGLGATSYIPENEPVQGTAYGGEPYLPAAPQGGYFPAPGQLPQAQTGVRWTMEPDEPESSDVDSDIDEEQYEGQDHMEAASLISSQRSPPLVTRWNPYPTLLFLVFLAATGFYFYVRVAHTLKPMGSLMWYGIFILCVELLGLTAMLPYALLLVRSTLPSKHARGLPKEGEIVPSEKDDWPMFHVHVLVPCYKEPIEVVSKTVQAAFEADLPVNCRRSIYLCDDAVGDNEEGKQLQSERRQMIFALDPEGSDVKHITGRVKKKGEGNGKSNNVNNCLQNHIFQRFRTVTKLPNGDEKVEWDHSRIPASDVVVIFDSDMVCNKDFFCRILEVMADGKVALCLTPQAFTNTNPRADVFNNVNFQFWEYWLPGSDAQGYIACTGTNFCIRAKMLAHAGWFPTYTITEDYALGMELKRRGYIGKYLLNYMVYGEAPDNIRNVFRQRSRWCKGHMQVFFSRRCPLVLPGLPFAQRLWYSYGTWCYFVSIVTIPVFMLAPVLALIAGIMPVYINRWFAIAATIYYVITFLIQNYCRKLSHMKGLWFANVSNTVLWFTYTKAVISVLSSKLGLKIIGFKATVKKGEPGAAPVTVMDKLKDATRRMTFRVGTIMRNASLRGSRRGMEPTDPLRFQISSDSTGQGGDPSLPPSRAPSVLAERKSGPQPDKDLPGRVPVPPQSRLARPPIAPGPFAQPAEQQRLLAETPIESAPAVVPKKKKKMADKVFLGKSWRTVKGAGEEFRSNVGSMEGTWDLFALFIILLVCLATFAAGIWRLTHHTGEGLVSYADIGVPMMWALYNAVPAYLFIHYCFAKGKSLETASSICQMLQALLGLGAMAFLWVLLPNDYDHRGALSSTMKFFEAQQSGAVESYAVSQVPWLKPSGLNMQPPGGWFSNGDHLKYTVPMANAASMLAWGYIAFPGAYRTANAKTALLQNLRWVGTYLKDCYTEGADQRFVYRVGNPEKYVIFNLPNNTMNAGALQPEKLNSTWTSPDQDPELNNPDKKYHRILYKGAGGEELAADVLGSAAGALAAIAKVFEKEDSGFSKELIDVAIKVYTMQTSSKGKERSSCSIKDSPNQKDSPCWAVRTVQVQVPYVNVSDGGSAARPILCWVPDWIQTSCVPSYTKVTCDYGKIKGKNFLQPTDCCSYMQGTNVWNGTTPKGICALPGYDAKRPCFLPNLIINSCEESKIDMATGTGCGGPGMAVYASADLCCNALAMQGRFSANNPAHGLCAPQLKVCYVPSLSQMTCLRLEGADCTRTGMENLFESELGCCDYLAKTMQERQMGFPQGNCKSKYVPPPPPPSPPIAPPNRTGAGRKMLQTRNGTVGNTTRAPPGPPTPPTIPFVEQVTTPWGEMRIMERNVTATFYNSTYMLDDMAWGGAWLYFATGNPSYLGDAEYYLEMHRSRELRFDTLTTDPTYYISNWDNMAWATNVLLADITKAPQYVAQVRNFFNTWIGNPPRSPTRELYQRQVALNTTAVGSLNSVAMPNGMICTPTARAEVDCADGKDDDCNGLIDEADPNCPFKPVKYIDKLAWTPDAPLPNAANAAFLAMVLGNAKGISLPKDAHKKMKCWALGQVDYILGESGRSYLVGYGKNYPLRPQHRGASCADNFTCDWGNFYSGAPNPHVLKGALVAGPDYGMPYPDDRTHPSSRVGVDYTAPLSGALAGIIHSKINVQECSQWKGLIQNVWMEDTKV